MTLPPLVPPTAELSPGDLTRYSRQVVLPEVGVDNQRRLRSARVLVIGAGGLGSPVLLYLAAAGVGTIGIVEDDVVEASNLHRQVLHADASLGRPKVDSAADAIATLNPSVLVQRHPQRLDADNAAALVSGYDLIVDGSDNFPTRYLVNDICAALDKPLVWGSVLGFAAQVAVFWAGAPDGRGVHLRDVFPAPPTPGTVPSCAEAGVIGALCGQAGSVMAMEAIKLITGIGRSLLGRVLVIDALNGRWDELPLHPDASRTSAQSGPHEAAPSVPTPAPSIWEPGMVGIDAGTFLLDVRGPDEFAAERIAGSINVPLPGLLAGDTSAVPREQPILVVCRSGARAELAAAYLGTGGFTDVQVLSGGLLGLAERQSAR